MDQMTSKDRVFILMLSSLLASGIAFTQSKPSVDAEMIVDYLAPPTTLDEAVQLSDAVVLGSIRSVRTYQPPIAYAAVRLLYTVEVSDVLRSHSNLTVPIVQVYRFGGDIDEGDHVTRKTERDFPRFAIGHQYLMFLSWCAVAEVEHVCAQPRARSSPESSYGLSRRWPATCFG
jgi:hypothetical protein